MSKNLEEFEKKVKEALERASKPANVGLQGQVLTQRLLDLAKRKGATPSQPPSA